MKKRLDIMMVEQGLAPSREKAKAYIMAGEVYVNGQKEDKAGSMFAETVKLEVRGKTLPYVSRGGLKLEKAMKNFGVTLKDKVCMDVGASTGGFTDCMLQNGAVKVYSIDVGYGQLDWKLRNDPRVVCMEKTNIRYVVPEDLEGPAAFSSIDVSFISLTKVLLPVRNLLTEDGEIVCLIKPQFEAGREKVGKKGVVRDPKVHEEVIEKVRDYAMSIATGEPLAQMNYDRLRQSAEVIIRWNSDLEAGVGSSISSAAKRDMGILCNKMLDIVKQHMEKGETDTALRELELIEEFFHCESSYYNNFGSIKPEYDALEQRLEAGESIESVLYLPD